MTTENKSLLAVMFTALGVGFVLIGSSGLFLTSIGLLWAISAQQDDR